MQIHREQTNSGYLNTQTSNDNGKKRHQTSCGAAKTKTKRSSVSISSCCCLRSPATSFIPKQKRSRSCIYISENQKKKQQQPPPPTPPPPPSKNYHFFWKPYEVLPSETLQGSQDLPTKSTNTDLWDLWDLRMLGMVRQNLVGMIWFKGRSSWWFQPISEIFVKLDHFPKYGWK